MDDLELYGGWCDMSGRPRHRLRQGTMTIYKGGKVANRNGAVLILGLLVCLSLSVCAFIPPRTLSLHPASLSLPPSLRPDYRQVPVDAGTPSTRLLVSSIRTWFSFVYPRKDSKSSTLTKSNKSKNSSIFFKRYPDKNSSHTQLESKTLLENATARNQSIANLSEVSSVTTWANMLHDEDNSTKNTNITDNNTIAVSANLSDTKRQSLQYGIFAPSSSWYFPDYTSAWANTLSSSLHNTTSNAWSKMAFTPLQASTPSPIAPNTTYQILGIPSYLRPSDTLTVADLQAILERNGIEQQRPILPAASLSSSTKSIDSTTTTQDMTALAPNQGPTGTATTSRKSKSQGVAFPKPSVMDHKSLQRGTTVAGAMLGMLLGTTILPNLWLMGLFLGALYGHDICSRPEEPPPSDLLARNLISWGRRLAQITLQFMDYCQTLWFLYKTGQLSYQYYKQYEAIDQRFSIQAKIDAWNARFQDGKRQFDKWEQENEIGRTVLAGLRTIWLVDEQAKRRAKQKSRYRLVQSLYDTKYWLGKWYIKIWKALKASTWSESLKDYFEGIRTDLMKSTGGSWGTRLGAVAASLIAVNILGALFAISPTFLALLAVGVGIAWPSWVSELYARLNTLMVETRARGRGEETPLTESSFQPLNTARLLGRYDKTRYHFFRRADGTKRYYRTGQSLFQGRRNPTKATTGKSNSANFSWPWTKPQRVRRQPGKEQWGILSKGSKVQK